MDILENLTLDEFKQWYAALVTSSGKAKKISIQVRQYINIGSKYVLEKCKLKFVEHLG